MSHAIGDDTTAVYSFEWNNGSERTTREIEVDPDSDVVRSEAIAGLVAHAERDDECEVSLVGFE